LDRPVSSLWLTRRRLLGTMGVLGLSLVLPARARETKLSLNEVLAHLRRASPLGTWVMAQALADPGVVSQSQGEVRFSPWDAGAFVRHEPKSRLLRAASVMVHESCHYLSRVLAAQNDPEALAHPGSVGLVLQPGRILVLRGRPVPSSRQAAGSFPPFLKNSQRFATYIGSSTPDMTTQQYGIFGLLDEFAAYHAGTRAGLDLVRDMVRRPSGSASDWVTRLADADATVVAWPEFRGYILAWMAWVRRQKPELFTLLLSHPNLRRAFREIDRSYGAISHAWYRDLPNLLSALGNAGIRVQARGEALLAGGQGRVLFHKEFEAILTGIQNTPELVQVDRLLTSS
jgi:hypothetical protein